MEIDLMFLILIKHSWESGDNIDFWFENDWCNKGWGSMSFTNQDEQLDFLLMMLNECDLDLLKALLDETYEQYYFIVNQEKSNKINSTDTYFQDDLSEIFGMTIERI